MLATRHPVVCRLPIACLSPFLYKAAASDEGDLSRWKRSADGAYSDSSPRTNCHIDGTAILITQLLLLVVLGLCP